MKSKLTIISILVIGIATAVLYLMMADSSSMQSQTPLIKDDSSMMKEETPTEDKMNETQIKDEPMMEDKTTDESMMDDENAKVFEVEGGGFYFSPNEITVNEGDTVKIVFTNAGGVHDWVIDEFNARTKIIQAGQTDSVTFVADKAGEYEFYCSVGDHRERGMVGMLKVM